MKDYKVRDGQDIFSVAVEVYGSPIYAIRLSFDNNLTINEDITGLTLVYDETVRQEIETPLLVKSEVSTNLSQTYKPRANQTIFDIALMTLGGLESIVNLVKNSTIESINSEIKPSDLFTYQDSNNDVKRYLTLTGRTFSTGTVNDEDREHDDSFSRAQFT